MVILGIAQKAEVDMIIRHADYDTYQIVKRVEPSKGAESQ